MANDPGYFVWYELMTTDVAAAAAFYCDAVGWATQEAPTPQHQYTLFTTSKVPAAGLMDLPEEARRMGLMPRWMGYVSVRDVHATVDRIKRLGGSVHVPPSDTNIGRISVVADPCAAVFAIVDRLETPPQRPRDSAKLGHVGWHELLAADLNRETAYYCELFGWQKVDKDKYLAETYLSLSMDGQILAGAFKKSPDEPVPFWLFYFNVEDLDAAVERVRAGGGRAYLNDAALSNGLWIAQCADPQGAAFALQGKRKDTPKVGWRTEWQGFSTSGRLVEPKLREEE